MSFARCPEHDFPRENCGPCVELRTRPPQKGYLTGIQKQRLAGRRNIALREEWLDSRPLSFDEMLERFIASCRGEVDEDGMVRFRPRVEPQGEVE